MKNFDNSFLNENVKYVAGTDEAGRGPLAGPVVAAAVLFDKEIIIEGVNDSKKLNEKTRESLYDEITSKALAWSYTIIDNEMIDKINILQASLKAMKESVNKLEIKPDLVLIDGNKTFFTEIPVKTVVKGDSKSFAIAAASIIAKVTRDRLMKKASEEYPEYLWFKNKGYPTQEHIAAVKKYGPCELHRKTFLGRILEDTPELRII